jgi:signal peptide peptidase SppA
MRFSAEVHFPTFKKFFGWLWENLRKPIGWFILIAIGTCVGNVLSMEFMYSEDNTGSDATAITEEGSDTAVAETEACNIARLSIDGDILPYYGANYDGSGNDPVYAVDPETTLYNIKTAENNKDIKGIIAVINSYGGDGSAGSTIANALKNSKLPTASYIRSAGNSAAYLIATGADTIIASPWSDVGSIGVTMSYLDNTALNKKEGLTFVPLAAGKYKDYTNPDKPLTADERTLLERDLRIMHQQFIKEVASNRGLTVDVVTKVADGSSMPGALALQNKLVDQLGDEETARAWFAKKLGIPNKDVIFCE